MRDKDSVLKETETAIQNTTDNTLLPSAQCESDHHARITGAPLLSSHAFQL